MIILSREECAAWRRLGEAVEARNLKSTDPLADIRPGLKPHFHFFAGSLLASMGRETEGMEWYRTGMLEEAGENMANAFMAAFLERHGGKMRMPAVLFADPRPYLHFTGVPAIRKSRESFLRQAAATLPRFPRPLRIMDVGCGDGGLLVLLLRHLRDAGRVGDIGHIYLTDASEGMLAMARKTVHEAFPDAPLTTIHGRIQDVSADVPDGIDVALMSLSYHHLPLEVKRAHLRVLGPRIGHFLLFEFNADHDTPELRSPELAVSVYQCYGRIIDDVFAHDAPVEIVQACVDNFLMAEVVSFFTEPRGKRNDYHMLRQQWNALFEETLAPVFSPLGEFPTYSHEGMEMFFLHYGRQV
jgi:SAM-dependent methyltransferase